uniref:Thymidylate kinase n=1 Tax=Salmonella phage vB_SEnST11_KE23 TaxID=3161174 RepID=A0AAU8GIM2_9CAUD
MNNPIDVRVTNVLREPDWDLVPFMKDDQLHRDMIKYFEEQRLLKERELLMGTFDTTEYHYGYADDVLGGILDHSHKYRLESDPLIEIIQSLIQCGNRQVHEPFYWMWGKDIDGKTNIAMLEIEIHESPRDFNNPWGRGEISGNVKFIIRGHGNGDGLLQGEVWRFTPRTRQFLRYIQPLIKGLGLGYDLVIDLEYQRTPKHTYSSTQSNFELRRVVMVCGQLLLDSALSPKTSASDLHHVCWRLDHSVLQIKHRTLNTKEARKAFLVCNKYETMLKIELEQGLQNLMLGDTPTPEEELMMEMAGYKNEFWLDNIDGFDKMQIKPFDLQETIKWYEQQRQIFKI